MCQLSDTSNHVFGCVKAFSHCSVHFLSWPEDRFCIFQNNSKTQGQRVADSQLVLLESFRLGYLETWALWRPIEPMTWHRNSTEGWKTSHLALLMLRSEPLDARSHVHFIISHYFITKRQQKKTHCREVTKWPLGKHNNKQTEKDQGAKVTAQTKDSEKCRIYTRNQPEKEQGNMRLAQERKQVIVEAAWEAADLQVSPLADQPPLPAS